MDEKICSRAVLWRWTSSGSGAWHFARIAGEAGRSLAVTALMRKAEGLGRGFGSLRVTATIGDSRWKTSVFPQKAHDGEPEWLLPVKAAVRKAQGLAEGDELAITLEF